MSDVQIYTVTIGTKTYLAVREQPPIGRPSTEVYIDGKTPSKRVVRRVREAIQRAGDGA